MEDFETVGPNDGVASNAVSYSMEERFMQIATNLPIVNQVIAE
jgi:hypothetical protein